MKKLRILSLLSVAMIMIFCGCAKGESKDKTSLVKECVNSYFSYYENGEYENMKEFCSDEFVKQYFHEKDVFGSSTAKLIKIEEIKYDKNNDKYVATVYIECMPVAFSALYNKDKPDEAVNTYVSLVVNVSGDKAQIEAFED